MLRTPCRSPIQIDLKFAGPLRVWLRLDTAAVVCVNYTTMSTQIDRTKRCPALLQVFLSSNHIHTAAEFNGDITPSEPTNIYVWPDTTLRELLDSVRAAVGKSFIPDDASVIFQVIFPNRVGFGDLFIFSCLLQTGKLALKRIGEFAISSRDEANSAASKQLSDCGYEPGDGMSCSIMLQKSESSDEPKQPHNPTKRIILRPVQQSARRSRSPAPDANIHPSRRPAPRRRSRTRSRSRSPMRRNRSRSPIRR